MPQKPRPGEDDDRSARAWDRLADPSPTRVGVDAAMRVRDVSRPTAQDLAEAEETVVVRHSRVVAEP